MVTKLKNLSWLYDFIAMETTVVLNNFQNAHICVTTFLNDLYTMLFVVMVIKFNNLSWFYDSVAKETTVVLINFPKTYIFVTTLLISVKNNFYTILWHTLCHLVSSPLKGTLCHLVSCGGTKWQNDTKLYNYTTWCLIPLSVLTASGSTTRNPLYSLSRTKHRHPRYCPHTACQATHAG